MLKALAAIALSGCLAVPLACADELTPAAQPKAKSEADFEPPPGFRVRKRGDKIVYCQRTSIAGSKLAGEKCYDRAQLREIEASMELQRQEIEQRRRICAGCS